MDSVSHFQRSGKKFQHKFQKDVEYHKKEFPMFYKSILAKIRNCLLNVEKVKTLTGDYKPSFRFDQAEDYNKFKRAILDLVEKDEKFTVGYEDNSLFVNDVEFPFCKNRQASEFIDEFFEALGVKYTDDSSVDEVKSVVKSVVKPVVKDHKYFVDSIKKLTYKTEDLNKKENEFKAKYEGVEFSDKHKITYNRVIDTYEAIRRKYTTELSDLQILFDQYTESNKLDELDLELNLELQNITRSDSWADIVERDEREEEMSKKNEEN